MPQLVLGTAPAFFYRQNGAWRLIHFLQNEDGTFSPETADLPADGQRIEWTAGDFALMPLTVCDSDGRRFHFEINADRTELRQYVHVSTRSRQLVYKIIITVNDLRSIAYNTFHINLSPLDEPPLPEAKSISSQARHQEEDRSGKKATDWSEFCRVNRRWPFKKMISEMSEEKIEYHFVDTFGMELPPPHFSVLSRITRGPRRFKTPEEVITALNKIAAHFVWIKDVEPDFPLLDWEELQKVIDWLDSELFELAVVDDVRKLENHRYFHNLIRKMIKTINITVGNHENDNCPPEISPQELKNNRDIYNLFSSGRVISLIDVRSHQYLVDIGLLSQAHIKRTDGSGNTMLHMAAMKANTEFADLLIKNGADLDVENDEGKTPLHIAAQYRHKSIVQLLRNAGVRLDAKDKDKRTPLHLVFSGNRQNQDDYHVYITHQNNYGEYEFDPVLLLPDRNYISIPDQNGDSPLSLAIKSRQWGAAAKFIHHHLSEQDEFLQAFQKIYSALYKGQSGLFKSSFHHHENIKSVFDYAWENPSSRTAKALELAAKYVRRPRPDGQQIHPDLFREIYAYAFSKGTWFGVSNVSGTRFCNFFAKPLADNIHHIEPSADDVLDEVNNTSRSVKIGRALTG